VIGKRKKGGEKRREERKKWKRKKEIEIKKNGRENLTPKERKKEKNRGRRRRTLAQEKRQAKLEKKIGVKIAKLHPDAQIPQYQTPGSAGFDFVSVERVELKPGEWRGIATGLAIELPEGYELQVRPRSGLALKKGVSVLNSPGTIDSDYRGEIKVILINFGQTPVILEKGERIAQGVIAPVVQAQFGEVEVEELTPTQRGSGGFGSTGIK